MITVMTIGYIACIVVAFKVIKIKPTPPSIAVATLIGVFMLGGVVICWKQAAPITGQMFLRRRVLQINPDVREFVSKVHVEGNQIVSKGDPIFDITPDRFQNAVDQSTAELAAAKSTVLQLEAAVSAAEAAVKKSAADTGVAKAELDTALNLQAAAAGAIARLKVEEMQDSYNAAQADDKVAEASLKQTRFSLAAAKHAGDAAEAALSGAKFNLEKCTFVSPVDGQVMNMQITEGTPVARWRFTSTGTIMDFSDTAIAAILPQNQLKNVKPGDDVEIAFKSMPGQIATGKVEVVIKYTGEGQFMPTAKLPDAVSIGSKGYLAVRIRLYDEELAKKLPLGAAGTTTIYTDFGKPFHLISKITIRIKGWMYYLPI
jgi:membrane fusion protein (multidrug efflux system)